MAVVKDSYNLQVARFHSELEDFVGKEYGVALRFSKKIAHGYQSFAVYAEGKDQGKYIIKLTKPNHTDAAALTKDVAIANHLREHTKVPVPRYLQTKKGHYLSEFKARKVRVQHHLEGVAAHLMTADIIKQAVYMLQQIHAAPLPDFLPQSGVLIHGDLTPSNILVSYDIITGIIDFERATTKTKEYDLGRFAVFAFMRAKDLSFSQILQIVLDEYQGELDSNKMIEGSTQSLEERITNLIKHKSDYKAGELNHWQADFDFSKTTLKLLEKKLGLKL